MKVIFLDFDGVLVNGWSMMNGDDMNYYFWRADPKAVAALNRLIAETGASICVSSTWRLGNDIPYLEEMLRDWGVVGEVIGKTPWLKANSLRGHEILDWIQKYEMEREEITSLVILDDNDDMAEMTKHLVQTEEVAGLTEADVDKAIEVLKRAK